MHVFYKTPKNSFKMLLLIRSRGLLVLMTIGLEKVHKRIEKNNDICYDSDSRDAASSGETLS